VWEKKSGTPDKREKDWGDGEVKKRARSTDFRNTEEKNKVSEGIRGKDGKGGSKGGLL